MADNIISELNMIAGSRQSDLNDDGHVIAKGAAEIERLRAAILTAIDGFQLAGADPMARLHALAQAMEEAR